jgi:hypothetical protein
MFVGGLKDERNVNEYGFGVLKCSCCDGFSLTLFSFFHIHTLSLVSTPVQGYEAIMREQKQKKKKNTRENKALPEVSSSSPRPQEAHQVPNTTGLMRFVSQFSRHRSLASRFTSFIFSKVATTGMQRECYTTTVK